MASWPAPVSSSSGSAPAVVHGVDPALAGAAEQFEGLFVAQMFKAMRQAAASFGAADAGADGSNAVLELAYARVADDIARQHAFGIADCLIAQLSAHRAVEPLSSRRPLSIGASP